MDALHLLQLIHIKSPQTAATTAASQDAGSFEDDLSAIHPKLVSPQTAATTAAFQDAGAFEDDTAATTTASQEAGSFKDDLSAIQPKFGFTTNCSHHNCFSRCWFF